MLTISRNNGPKQKMNPTTITLTIEFPDGADSASAESTGNAIEAAMHSVISRLCPDAKYEFDTEVEEEDNSEACA